MDGEHLDSSGLRILRPRREVLAQLGLAQPGEEAAESRDIGEREVSVEGVVERLDRGGAERAVVVRDDLDVELQLLQHDRDEVGQVEPGARAQLREEARRIPETLEAGLAERLQEAVTLPRGTDEIERVDDRAALALGDGGAQLLLEVVVVGALRVVPVPQRRGEPIECVQVLHADAPARSREQADEFEPRGRVLHDGKRGDEIGDLGFGEQSAEAEHMERDALLAQRFEEEALHLAGAEQHRGRRLLAHPCCKPLGSGPGLGAHVLLERDVDGERARERARLQPLDRCAERLDERVRRFEDDRPVAPARRERVALLRSEGGGEVVEVGGARAAPSVDRLVRVADRHDRMRREQLGQQPGLGDRRVLVLVEQHDAEFAALLLRDLAPLPHDREGESHLVGVLDEPARELRGVVLGGDVEQGVERRDVLDEGVDARVRATAAGRQGRESREAGREGAHLRGVDHVLRNCARQAQHGLRDGVDVLRERREPRILAADHGRAGELPRRGLAEHRSVALAPEHDGVVAVDAVRVGVVRLHRRRLERVVVVAEQPHVRKLGDALPDARAQLPRGLARESQAEDLARPDELVREQPQHAVGHGLGLAAARPGDDE